MDLILVRLLFVVVVSLACYFIEPFRLSQPQDAGVGAVVGTAIVQIGRASCRERV